MKWPLKPVSDVCIFAFDCVNKTAPTVEYETPYEMIRTTNIKGGFVYLDEVKYVTEEVFIKWTRRSAPEYGDVVLTREAPVGEVGRCTFKDRRIFLGQRLFHYRPNPDLLDWNYLAYVLQSWDVQGRLRGMGFGATVDHIKVGDAENLLIPYPPPQVQRQIGSTLSAYDDLIENNWRRIQLLEESARLLYREWFVRLRFPGHEHTKIVDGVPEGWERTFLPNIIDVNPKTPVEKNKEIPYVPMSSLSETGMTVDLNECETRTSHTSVKFKNGDILLARITPCLENGKTGFVYFLNNSDVACGSTEFIILRGTKVSPYFTYCLSRSYDFRENAIKSMIGSSGRQRVQTSCFDEFLTPFPPTPLLTQFNELVSDSFEQIRVLTEQNLKLQKARDLLLPRLMSGEITV